MANRNRFYAVVSAALSKPVHDLSLSLSRYLSSVSSFHAKLIKLGLDSTVYEERETVTAVTDERETVTAVTEERETVTEERETVTKDSGDFVNDFARSSRLKANWRRKDSRGHKISSSMASANNNKELIFSIHEYFETCASLRKMKEDGHSYSEDLKLFVGNLPFNVDSAQLFDLFSNAGNVKVSEVICNKSTGRSRGFGFVIMSSTDEVEAAAKQFNGYELEGRAIRVNSVLAPLKESSFSRRPRGSGDSYGSRVGGDSYGSRRGNDSFGSRGGGDFYGSRGGGGSFDGAKCVYVGNLSWNVDNVALETLFSEQGKVLDAKVVYDRESGRSRGFGFVSYGSSQEVDSAIESLNGVEMDGRSIRVSAAVPRRQF